MPYTLVAVVPPPLGGQALRAWVRLFEGLQARDWGHLAAALVIQQQELAHALRLFPAHR